MKDTWNNRDLPVLNAIVEAHDTDGRVVRTSRVVTDAGLDENTVNAALRALESESPPLLEGARAAFGGTYILAGKPTGHARRAVGAWPTADSLVDSLIATLHQSAGDMDEPASNQEQSKAREILKAVGSGGRDVLVSVASAVLTGAVT